MSLCSLILILATVPAQANRSYEQIDRIDSKIQLTQALIVITGVQLQKKPDGIEIILETANGETLDGTTVVEGNNLIVEIPNAQLQLLDGQEFYQENPIEDIAAISIIEFGTNSVRITVTGIDAPPDGEIISSQQGLILSIIPPLTEIIIVSTAEKQPENVQNVPVSVTVITQQEIRDADITSFSGIAANTPNFTVFTPNRNFILYSIRGLSNFNFLSRDPVAFYVVDLLPSVNGEDS
ncbi:AMIN domain-containing protein [Aphanothece hegewaldii]|nr:AMIN domain-containing protein [Aphanothece hegewaldii]